jgi:hypothetical protein
MIELGDDITLVDDRVVLDENFCDVTRDARRNRADVWYIHKAGHIDVCNITVPVRDAKLGSRPIS